MLPYWLGEIERVIAGPVEPVPFGREPTDLVRVLTVDRDRTLPVSELYARLDNSLERVLRRLLELDERQAARRGLHKQRGEMTVRQIVDTMLAGHIEEHCRQMAAALDAEAAVRVLTLTRLRRAESPARPAKEVATMAAKTIRESQIRGGEDSAPAPRPAPDLKKALAPLFNPPRDPVLVDVPELGYLMIDGAGRSRRGRRVPDDRLPEGIRGALPGRLHDQVRAQARRPGGAASCRSRRSGSPAPTAAST